MSPPVSLVQALHTVRCRFDKSTVPMMSTSHEEVVQLFRTRPFHRWDAPLNEVIKALARYDSVMNKETLSPNTNVIKRMFDMEVEHVPEFLKTTLRVKKVTAERWCQILWLDRMA